MVGDSSAYFKVDTKDATGSKNGEDVQVSQLEELSLSDAYERMGYGWQQIRVILICGLCFCTDSIEVGLLSFLQVEAKQYFHLSDVQESVLSSSVFGGQLLGALLFGPFADKYGRRIGSFVPAVLIASAGLISAFSVNIEMLIAMRFFVGVGIGGVGVTFDLLAEMMPAHLRGRALLTIEFFWTFGTMLVNGLAWGTLETLGWRYLVAFTSIPVILAIFSFHFLPESPHWLLSVGENDAATKVIRKAAKLNSRLSKFPENFVVVPKFEPPEDGKTFVIMNNAFTGDETVDTLVIHEDGEDGEEVVVNESDDEDEMELLKSSNISSTSIHENQSHSPLRLFSKDFRMITILLWVTWITFGFAYYGTVILTPTYFSTTNTTAILDDDDDAISNDSSDFDFPALFAAGAAEFLGGVIGFILVDFVSRRWLGGTAYFISGVATTLLIINMSKPLGIFVLVIARAGIFLGSSMTWIVTPEMFPTSIRAVGHSWCNAMARMGAFLTPYWGDASSISLSFRILVYGTVTIVSAISTLLLPETKGISLT